MTHQELLLLGLLCAIFGTGLHTTLNALGIQSAADDVITYTGQVLYTAAADHNYRVFLQRMTYAGDVSGHFVTIGQTDTGDLTQCGVGLLRSRSTDCGADASLLGGTEVGLLVLESVQALLHCRGGGLVGDLFSSLSYQLVKGRHCFLLSFVVMGFVAFDTQKP